MKCLTDLTLTLKMTSTQVVETSLTSNKSLSLDYNKLDAELITVKTCIKEQVFWGFGLILFLYIGCFQQNQPENVLKVFLKLFL